MRRLLLCCALLSACGSAAAPKVIDGLSEDTVVYGIEIGGSAAAYTTEAIRRDAPIQSYLMGEGTEKIPLQITWDASSGKPVFMRYFKDEPGKSEEIIPVSVLWKAWVREHPEANLYR